MISKLKCGLLTACLGLVLGLSLVSGQAPTYGVPIPPPAPVPVPTPTPAPAPAFAPATAHPNPTQSTDPDYVLQPNDFIQIVVFQEDDLTTTTRLSANGNIVLPLIGSVQVGGLTVADATTLIQKKYHDGYLKDPKIALTMVEYAARRFSVLGEVQHPGDFEMPQQEAVSILNAIALAGGFTDAANSSAVSMRRNVQGKEQMFTIDAKQMAKESTHTPFNIEPGDVITVAVASKRFFSVLGEVQKPGSYEMQEETPVSILNAIAEAGGFLADGDARAVKVQRVTGNNEQVLTIDVKEMAKESSHTPFNIEPGDVITVTVATQRLFSVLGQVQKPGSFPMQEETPVTILDAIAEAGGYTNIANPAKVNVRRKGAGAEQIFTINAKQMAKDSTQQPFYIQPGDVITVSETIF